VRTIQTARPRAELRDFVQVYAQREIECAGAGFSQPNTSALEQGIGFNFGGQTLVNSPYDPNRLLPKAHVFGGLTPPCGDTTFANHVLSFAVFLKPISLWQLFGIPSNIMVNRDYDAENVLGRDVLELWSRLAECATFRQRIRAMEEYLLLFAARARARTLIMKAAQYMLRRKGAVRIDVIAFHAALSVRQFERRFAEEAGMAPKLFAKTARFQNALDAKRLSPSSSWLSVAHELGYFDQMHMIRDFQRLGGSAPNGVLEEGGDIQPWSLAPYQDLEAKWRRS
jgi:methylphosphotriester-DNA--protein-cysteine methyltransferase